MKLTKAEALDLLKKVGVPDAELVEDDKADPEYKQDAAITAIDENRTPVISQKVLQGEGKKVHGEVTAKVLGGLRKEVIKLTAIPKEELEGKDATEIISLGIAHLNKTAGGDKEAHANQIKDIMSAHEKALEKTKTEWEQKYNAQGEQLTEKQMLDNLKAKYKTAKGIAPDANIDVLSKDFLTYAKGKYIVKLNADGTDFELYDKANPTVLALDSTKNHILKIDDNMLKEYHSPRMQWNEDARKVNPADLMKTRQTLDTTVTKDGKIETGLDKQMAEMEAWIVAK